MNTESPSSAVPSRYPQLAALVDLDDEAERFMVGVMLRFHGEDRLYRALAIRRATNDKGERLTIEVAKFQPQRRRARLKWMIIIWNTDDVSIRFKDCESRDDAMRQYAHPQ